MRYFWSLVILIVAASTPIYSERGPRKPPVEYWNNTQPGRLQDSSRWSKRNADHRRACNKDWHPLGVQEGEPNLAPLQGANVCLPTTGGLRSAPTSGYFRPNPPGWNTSIGKTGRLESYKTITGGQDSVPAAPPSVKIDTTYDSIKDRTTVKLAPVKISGDKDIYHSLHMAPSFSFPGHQVQTLSIIFFEIQIVVKRRLLDSDLYVDFLIDGEKIFLSSQNRYAVKHPVRGRLWMGEVLIFRMPYEIFVNITKAKEFAMRFDGVVFSVGESERKPLRELLAHMNSETNPR